MGRGQRVARQLAELLADAHQFTTAQFVVAAERFGMNASEATTCHTLLLTRSPEQLLQELDDVVSLSPQDARLPLPYTIVSTPFVVQRISSLDWTVLHAPLGHTFALGDTPLPQSDLVQGFRVPLSRSTAIEALPASTGPSGTLTRRPASSQEVVAINREQSANALRIVVGPDPAVLQAL